MKVYVIPLNKLSEWVSESFNPILDGLGNYVVAVDADYFVFPNNEDLAQCEIIDYVPAIYNIE